MNFEIKILIINFIYKFTTPKEKYSIATKPFIKATTH
jgi:hypothetical protein